MRCSDIDELLSAYANGELSRTQREFVEEHLSRCTDCRAALADYMAVRQQFSSLRVTSALPDIKDATMSRIKATNVLRKPIRRWTRPALIAVPIVAILIALLVLHPWSTLPGPQSVMAKAYAATASLKSYRMTTSLTGTSEGKTLEQSSEWEFVFPDRRHGKLTFNSETYEFIIIGDKQYVREPDNASGKMFSVASSGFIPSKEDTLQILDSLTDLQELPEEKIAGVDSLHYQGKVDMNRVAEELKAKLDPGQRRYEERLRAIEELRSIKTEIELWIGKDDYLIRQLKQYTDAGPKGISTSTAKYYDFNKVITIEPPLDAHGELLPEWRLMENTPKEQVFSRDVTFTIRGDDPAHQQINFRITITNIGIEEASNVRVTLSTMATNEESGSVRMEAEPSTPGPVNLEPSESETYYITWEYDASNTSKEELVHLVNLTTILARYITPEREEAVQLLFPDAPYPSKTPPKSPPG